jgi:hypothetical protein
MYDFLVCVEACCLGLFQKSVVQMVTHFLLQNWRTCFTISVWFLSYFLVFFFIHFPGCLCGIFRFEDQLLTEQQLMLQASLLQYPHFGVFPGAAAAAAAAAASSGLYPGLAAASAAGIRFPPSDYYAAAAAAQSMPPGLLLPAVKFPNASSSNWLGLDR